jgi:hypothetical protein
MKFSFVREAVEEKADLGAFREKPGPRIIIGLFLILFSYVIGWPLITLIGIVAALYREPLLIVLGGPLTYGISHLTLMLGVYLAGARHSKIFLRWATRKAVEKMLNSDVDWTTEEKQNKSNYYK